LNEDQQGLQYQKQKCSQITEANIKEGIFMAKIKRLIRDNDFHNVARICYKQEKSVQMSSVWEAVKIGLELMKLKNLHC
jgi:hypothetical protein